MKVSGLARPENMPRSIPDGALLRLPIDEAHWAEQVPPVPAGFEVSASFSSAATADEHGEALELLGYSLVGIHSTPMRSAMLLVSQALLEAHPTYWRSLAALADAAYSLSLGPAVMLLDDVLRLHTGRPPR